MKEVPFALILKLTQHCLTTILQSLKKKKKAAPAEIGRSTGEGDMTVQPPFPRICYLLLVSFDRNPNQMI